MSEALERVLYPSLPATGWEELEKLLRQLTGISSAFQVDIVDGSFATPASWPFTETAPLAAMRKLRPYAVQFAIEVDCMVEKPEQYFATLAEIGIQRVMVHFGSFETFSTVERAAHDSGLELGLAFTNDVPLAVIKPFLPHVAGVQVMGIAVVGKQGQPFDERTLATVAALRAEYPKLQIAVDGAVNDATIPALLAAGANRFAPGSAIAQAYSPKRAFAALQSLLEM